VDFALTSADNSGRGHALSGAAGASGAAAYVSGVVALGWGNPPLEQLLLCRSKTSASTRSWVHVDFLRELSKVDTGASCGAATEAFACS